MATTVFARVPSSAQDVVLALFVTTLQVQGVLTRGPEASEQAITEYAGLGLVLLIVPGLALVFRRQRPVEVFLTAALASAVYYPLDFSDGPGWLALFVALYTLTAYGDGRRSIVLAGAGITVLAAVWLLAARDIEPAAAIGWVFFRIGASVGAAALGESVRTRRVIVTDALRRAEYAERTREEEARARVNAERLRIAREVHDTVAHAIAVINVQAGVTAHVLDERPDRVRETLEGIEQTSSRALQEMRTVLGVLRDPDNSRAPHPGLAQLDDLTATARNAGLDVEVEPISPHQPLPTAVDSAAYRIVQESLTNVIRHAGPTRVRISLNHGSEDLQIRVTDAGRRGAVPVPPEPLPEPGRGILGMQERCRLLGGDLTAGARPGGGFEVTARLPTVPDRMAT